MDFRKKPYHLLHLQLLYLNFCDSTRIKLTFRLPMSANSISHFPSFCSICPSKHKRHQRLQHFPCWNTAQNRPPVDLKIRASSIENSTSRRRRKVKSNAELCCEIIEFLIEAGFPVGHVPSMKELSEHGRNDLANIVRRRGYKVIRELLANSNQTDIDKSNTDIISNERQDKASYHEDALADLKSDDDFHAPQETSASLSIEERPMESSTDISLKEKVAKFIHNGELDMVKDNIDGLLKDGEAEERKSVEESEKEMESKSKISSEKNATHALSRHCVALASNKSTLTMRQVFPLATVNYPLRDDPSSAEGLPAADTDQVQDVETSKKDYQSEIDRLKSMLRQKELELSMLKEQIQKENLALTVLQAKAETEINTAQKLISDKDAELLSAEEGLSGLEEVEIHYCGDGEIVEVTGSFNGWHHRIKMDPQLSSNIMVPIGSRKSRVWSTVLWLYPGTYEIKFIVDGQWTIDPQRDSVTKGGICNNILRVKR